TYTLASDSPDSPATPSSMTFAPDGCTLYYTPESLAIKRFDVCKNAQQPDFVAADQNVLGGDPSGLAVRADGSVLVADYWDVRLVSPTGNDERVYTVPDVYGWDAVALDLGGTSFWATST